MKGGGTGNLNGPSGKRVCEGDPVDAARPFSEFCLFSLAFLV